MDLNLACSQALDRIKDSIDMSVASHKLLMTLSWIRHERNYPELYDEFPGMLLDLMDKKEYAAYQYAEAGFIHAFKSLLGGETDRSGVSQKDWQQIKESVWKLQDQAALAGIASTLARELEIQLLTNHDYKYYESGMEALSSYNSALVRSRYV
jgi:hypothetical protein